MHSVYITFLGHLEHRPGTRSHHLMENPENCGEPPWVGTNENGPVPLLTWHAALRLPNWTPTPAENESARAQTYEQQSST